MQQNERHCPTRTTLFFVGRTLYDAIFVALLQHESSPTREFGAVINASLKLGELFRQFLSAALRTPLPPLTPLTEHTRLTVESKYFDFYQSFCTFIHTHTHTHTYIHTWIRSHTNAIMF